MNKDLWHKIFKDYVESNKAINTLHENGVADDEETTNMQVKLLHDIIVTMESEIAE